MWRRKAVGGRRRPGGASAPFSVIDPGATTLRFLVVEIAAGADEEPSIVWGWDERRGLSDPGADEPSLTLLCGKAQIQAEAMAQELAGRWIMPDQILVGLPASQLRGRAWSVTQRRPRPDQPITERELEALLGRALRLAVNRLTDADDPGWLLVDAAPAALTVDDHRVTDPVGFRGQEVRATVFAALARRETVRTWGLAAHRLEFSTLILTAAPLALTAGLARPQGMLVDVGGATTDLTWQQAGRPVALESLAVGGLTLTRALIDRWGLSPERAERLKRAYAGGRLDEQAQAEVLEVLIPPLRDWLAETEAALARLNRDEPLPPHIHLLGGGSALPAMAEAVRSLAWSERLHFARYPQVSRLRPTDIPGVINRTNLGREAGDVSALALAAWAAHQGRAADRPTQILNRLWQVQDVDH